MLSTMLRNSAVGEEGRGCAEVGKSLWLTIKSGLGLGDRLRSSQNER